MVISVVSRMALLLGRACRNAKWHNQHGQLTAAGPSSYMASTRGDSQLQLQYRGMLTETCAAGQSRLPSTCIEDSLPLYTGWKLVHACILHVYALCQHTLSRSLIRLTATTPLEQPMPPRW